MTIITLDHPISQGERTMSSLTFQPAVVRHLMATDGKNPDDAAFVVAMAASMTGEPELLLRNLCPSDWVKVRQHIREAYAEFIGFNRPQIAALLALEVDPEDMREVIKDYARLHQLRPEQLLPVDQGSQNPTKPTVKARA